MKIKKPPPSGARFGVLIRWSIQRRVDRLLQLVALEGLIVAAVALFDWSYQGADLFQKLFFPTKDQYPSWDDLSRTLLIVLGVPAALLLWFWRDQNVRDQIENHRREINVSEFKDLQLRLAGALDNNIPEVSRSTVEMAALYQLSDYLHGLKGAGFKRAAFELFRARIDIFFQTSGGPSLQRTLMRNMSRLGSLCDRNSLSITQNGKMTSLVYKQRRRSFEWYRSLRDSSSFLGYRSFIDGELNYLLSGEFPVYLLKLHGIGINGKLLENVDASGAHMFSVTIGNTSITESDFSNANLAFSRIQKVSMQDCSFKGANCNGADFHESELETCDLTGAQLVRCRFWNCNISDLVMKEADARLC